MSTSDGFRLTSQGSLMAARVFDTYIPGAADTLVTFINSISDERIVCFAILVGLYIYISYMCLCTVSASTNSSPSIIRS